MENTSLTGKVESKEQEADRECTNKIMDMASYNLTKVEKLGRAVSSTPLHFSNSEEDGCINYCCVG